MVLLLILSLIDEEHEKYYKNERNSFLIDECSFQE